jgi:hypothetical protein
MRFQVLTAASMKMAAFWDLALCSLVEVHRRFRGACCLIIRMMMRQEKRNRELSSINSKETDKGFPSSQWAWSSEVGKNFLLHSFSSQCLVRQDKNCLSQMI